MHELFPKGAASHQELDEAEHRLRVATEEVKSASFAAQIAEFELELARATLARTRPTQSGNPGVTRFEVRSPVDGQVLRVFHEDEAAVPAGERILEVGSLTDMEVEVDVLSNDAVKIRPGAKAILEHWGSDVALLGRVRLVEPAAFTKVSALGVEEQRVNVLIDIVSPLNERKTLGDAFRVEARIVIWEGHDVLKVPAGALFRHAGGWAVFVVARGQARLRPVHVGATNGLESEVLEGLTENERVVLHPSDRVRDGVTVVGR